MTTRYPLSEALSTMTRVELGIEVDAEVDGLEMSAKVQQALWPSPKGKDSVTAPFFLNFWRLETSSRHPNEVRRDDYTLLVQCMAAESDSDQTFKGQLATLLWEEFLSAFDRNLALGAEGAYAWQISGHQDFMPSASYEWNGKGYIGWECEVSLTIVQQSSFGLGRAG